MCLLSASESVRKIFSLEFARKQERNKHELAKVIEKYRVKYGLEEGNIACPEMEGEFVVRALMTPYLILNNSLLIIGACLICKGYEDMLELTVDYKSVVFMNTRPYYSVHAQARGNQG